jgi:hypothetical protein
MRFKILPSPSRYILLHHYCKEVFPVFNRLFETRSPSPVLRSSARDPREADIAVILENRSEKPITAWRFGWQFVDALNQQSNGTTSGDSYGVDRFRPIADPASRHLITPSACVSESTVHRILSGAGIVASSSARQKMSTELTEVTFEIQLIVFLDGEIIGHDPDDYAVELQGRKRAAEFVAKQIRMAEKQGWDITPVLNALVEAPSLSDLGRPQGDPLFRSVRRYAGDYLRSIHYKMGELDMAKAKLRHLENRPALPNFYRRSESD